MFSVSRTIRPLSRSTNVLVRHASINSGTYGAKTWPNVASLTRVLKSEPRKVWGWSIAFFVALFAWPMATHDGSDYLDKVTKAKGEEVTVERTGLNEFKAAVDIPQTYAPIDKEEDDDE